MIPCGFAVPIGGFRNEVRLDMQTLTNFFANLSLNDPALWLALGAGLGVLLGFVFLGRRPSRARPPAGIDWSEVKTFESFSQLAADNWDPSEKLPDERRRSVRRAGMPTPIYVFDPKQSRKPRNGYVLDRSSGGLRLAVEKPTPTGITLQARPHYAADDTPWVNIIVRSCREVGDYYELGCQFEQELPWKVLLLFG
jgi:hypothetical protein